MLIHALFAAVGVGAVALLIRSVGVPALLAALRSSARWLPLLFALEIGRAAFEALATWSLSARVRQRVGLGAMARIHVIGFAVSGVMPAGRAAAETVKAAMLSRFVGAPEAAAIGVGNQSAALLGGAIAALPCAIAALLLTGTSWLTAAVGAFAAVTFVVTAIFQIALRRPALGGALLRRFTRTENATAAFSEAMARLPAISVSATLAVLGARALFTIELAVLLHAASGGASAGRALLAHGVSLVGGAAGDLVPGQLGASDGAFALGARYLGISAADGVAMAMTLHVLQLGWVALAAVPLVLRARPWRDAVTSA